MDKKTNSTGRLFSVLVLFMFLYGCKSDAVPKPDRPNDTVRVMQLALRTALLEHKLPEISPLFRGNLLHDSILVVTDSFPRRLLPATLDVLKFKFVSRQQVADQMRKVHDTLQANYLYVCCFEKADSIYSVSIQSRSDLPFGGGGSTYIDVVKRGDSMAVKHYASNSIN